jgi:hypothetical protein
MYILPWIKICLNQEYFYMYIESIKTQCAFYLNSKHICTLFIWNKTLTPNSLDMRYDKVQLYSKLSLVGQCGNTIGPKERLNLFPVPYLQRWVCMLNFLLNFVKIVVIFFNHCWNGFKLGESTFQNTLGHTVEPDVSCP